MEDVPGPEGSETDPFQLQLQFLAEPLSGRIFEVSLQGRMIRYQQQSVMKKFHHIQCT